MWRPGQGEIPPKGTRYFEKRAVRITVMIPSGDRRLRQWPSWGRNRLARDWYETMDRAGGGKSKTWWLYFGVIPPGRFKAVEFLDQGEVEP